MEFLTWRRLENLNKVYVSPRSITRNRGHPALKRLEAAGLEVLLASPGEQPSEEEQLKILPDCIAYLAGIEPINEKVLRAAKHLKIISRNGVGIESIDLETAKRLNIDVKIAPGSNARGVAELAIALMLSAIRHIPYCNNELKKGSWERRKGIEVDSKTLGIIGCGNIGKTVARLALGLNMKVIAYDLFPDRDFKPSDDFKFVSLEEIFKNSDIITLHCPPSEHPIIDQKAISQMKEGVFLINTARAGVIDKQAILDALNSKKILVYATDVYEKEPPDMDELLSHENVITMPHIGGYTKESINRAVETAVDNILNALNVNNLKWEESQIRSMEKELNIVQENKNEIELIWLGQAGFVLHYSGKQFIIDPYLSDYLAKKYEGKLFPHNRLMNSPINPEALRNVDYVLSTHPHSDHLDPETLAPISKNNPNCRCIIPSAAKEEAIKRGVSRNQIILATVKENIKLSEDIKITPIPAAHETFKVNDKGEHFYLGYLFQFGKIKIYHSGDCVPYDGLIELLKEERIDIALLPINGRDEYRLKNGIAGNFKIHEVLEICKSAAIKYLVVHHFGLFAYNTVKIEDLIQLEKKSNDQLRIIIPKINVKYKIHNN